MTTLDPHASVHDTVSAQARVDELNRCFAAAADATGTVAECDLEVAGGRVRLRSASAEMLAALSRAFSHIVATDAAEPDLTMHLWDATSAGGVGMPELPQASPDEPPGAFWYYSDERLRVGYQHGTSGDARVLAVYPHEATPALSVLDTATSTAWYWVGDAARIPYWEQATPMLYLFDWWLRDRDVHLLHAGAVGTEAGGVVIVGKSGSGKSTTTLSALQSPLRYAGDDYVAVSLDPPRVHSLYASGKLMPDHVRRLPFLLPALANPDLLGEEKAVVYVPEHWPEGMATGFPLVAIVVPKVAPEIAEATASRIPAAAGLAALAPSTVFQMHTRGQDSLVRMRRLAEGVPSYLLQVGPDMESIPRAIEGLIADLSSGDPV